MTLRRMWMILWARKRLFGAVFAGIVLIVLIVSLIWPKTYIAETSLVVDSKVTDPVSGIEQPSQYLASNIATQIDVIASHSVALKVVEKLRLASIPEMQQKFRDATNGVGSIRDWLADSLLRNLEVKPSRESHVINIDIATYDPRTSAEIANAFADAYIQTSLELKMDPARRQSAWFDEQLQALRKSLETSQKRLSDYQQNKSIVGTNDQIDIENGKLAEISNQLTAAQASMYEGRTRLKQMNQALQRGELQQLPDILGNPLLQSMKADLARAESKLAELGGHYGKNHPQYLSAAAEAKALREKITAEIETARGAIIQSAQLNERQESALRTALEHQRDRILQLKGQHDDLDVLKRDVENAQHSYDAGLQRATQVRLESHLDQSNIAVLNVAVPPLAPARPKVFLNLLVSIVVGFILAMAIALIVELSDPRVRSSEDLADSSGILVLGEIPRLVRYSKQRRFLRTSRPALLLEP